jgi:hypothetical protein
LCIVIVMFLGLFDLSIPFIDLSLLDFSYIIFIFTLFSFLRRLKKSVDTYKYFIKKEDYGSIIISIYISIIFMLIFFNFDYIEIMF